nr:immunoglobulin heavy chain junction region [Macaca mulatta]MOX62278.1 immunoglobulin heavy chain junction region [Macaca mulatta]MOX62652.1 immunoglobulin heavy chain junction region [Macaca mulatta]MOX63207.1 immunoglobulin heavy chain junction region [Macaca mulatta]
CARTSYGGSYYFFYFDYW